MHVTEYMLRKREEAEEKIRKEKECDREVATRMAMDAHVESCNNPSKIRHVRSSMEGGSTYLFSKVSLLRALMRTESGYDGEVTVFDGGHATVWVNDILAVIGEDPRRYCPTEYEILWFEKKLNEKKPKKAE